MANIDGLYVVRFGVGGDIMGGGVVSLYDGKIRGGDSLTLYLGEYRIDATELIGTLRAKVHSSMEVMTPVLGVADAAVGIRGSINAGRGMLQASSPQAPEVQLRVELERVADL